MVRHGCKACKQYSFKLGRCLLGKINPRTKKGAHEAARIMGWSYICNYNTWKCKHLLALIEKEEAYNGGRIPDRIPIST